ncbi:hypothetical protein EDD11_005877 [Mortierella claussenii]|nr:hypothetical protein EDD11_005877 [Mortierella claussenii]
MNTTQAALLALPNDLVTKLCRSKVTRLSLKQMYTLGRHVLESKNQSALVIPAIFLHQELPIRLSHALNMLNCNLLPFNMSDLPTFQHIARSYLEDISLVTQMPKPSTPQLEQEFTALLRNLEQRHHMKMLAISQGFKEFMSSLQNRSSICLGGTVGNAAVSEDESSRLRYNSGTHHRVVDPQMDKDIQTFFNRFYTINLGTRLLIGEHLALHDRGLNLVRRVNPLFVSKSAIQDAQRVCSAHYGRPAPSVVIQTLNPDISATYVEEFLHRNIYELLKNAMRVTCETHLSSQDGQPVSRCMSSASAKAAQSGAKLPPITLTLVDGGEDVTIKITDQGGGLALSELNKIWSYVHFANSAASKVKEKVGQRHTAASTATPAVAGTVEATGPDSVAFVGGLASEVKDYLNLPLSGSGQGLPLARLIARYFGGDLSLVSMEGYGTDAYLSLYRDDDHLENFPELDQEMLTEVDVFVNKLMDDRHLVNTAYNVQKQRSSVSQPPLVVPVTSLPSSMILGLRQSNHSSNAHTGDQARAPLDISTLPSRSDASSPAL